MMFEDKEYQGPKFSIDDTRICENCGAFIPMKDLLAYNLKPGSYEIAFKGQRLPVTTLQHITIYGCSNCNTLNISQELDEGRVN